MCDRERLARQILKVSKDDDKDAVRKAFWVLAMEHHPDKNPQNEEKFNEIVNAYDYLMREGSRGWHPETSKHTIGQYWANKWGYFCWWRDSYFQ